MIGARIKELRKALHLTQSEFGDRIGIKQNSVATLESERSEKSERTIRIICHEFNVNEDWLRTGEGDMFVELDPDEELMRFVGRITKDESSPLYRLAQKMAQMPPEVLEHLNAVIEYALAEEQKKDV